MDSNTGKIYPSGAAALAALAGLGLEPAEAEKRLVTGPLPALRRLSRLVKRDINARRCKKRRTQKASRKANRRG